MSIDEGGLSDSLDALALNAEQAQNGLAASNVNDSVGEEHEDAHADANQTAEGASTMHGEVELIGTATKKKKKKSKAKKAPQATEAELEAGRIKISRNKHMRFISSYHVCSEPHMSRARLIVAMSPSSGSLAATAA